MDLENKSQKGFAQVLIIIILAVLVVGGIGDYAYKNGQTRLPDGQVKTTSQSSPSPTPTIDTSNWKTYSSEAGWILKYPKNWYVYDKGYKLGNKNEYLNNYHTVSFSPNKFPESILEGTEFAYKGLSVSFDPSNLDLDKVLENAKNDKSFVSGNKIEVAGKSAVKLIYDSRSENNLPPAFREQRVLYKINYSMFNFSLLSISYNLSDMQTLEDNPYNQILSTLRFDSGL